MIWGIIGVVLPCLIVPPIVALILGVKANGKVNRGLADNKGEAVAGIILGAVGCAFAAIALLIFGVPIINNYLTFFQILTSQ
jgi:hypothetical protein